MYELEIFRDIMPQIGKVGAKFGVLSSTLKVIFEFDDMRHKRDVSTKENNF